MSLPARNAARAPPAPGVPPSVAADRQRDRRIAELGIAALTGDRHELHRIGIQLVDAPGLGTARLLAFEAAEHILCRYVLPGYPEHAIGSPAEVVDKKTGRKLA